MASRSEAARSVERAGADAHVRSVERAGADAHLRSVGRVSARSVGRAAAGARAPSAAGAALRAAVAALLALTIVLGLAGCGDDDGATAGGRDDGGIAGADDASDGGSDLPPVDNPVVLEGDEVAVTALDNLFRAPNIEVRPGTTVVWTNKGRNEHDVLPAGSDGWGVEVEEFQPGDAYRHTFDQPGVYHYYCSIHGTTTEDMVGAVVVAE